MSYNCLCGVEASLLTVKKDGPNKGRLFYTCKSRTCKFFYFEDEIEEKLAMGNYNPDRFKPGSCYRCGTWGCNMEDCEKTHDWFGNKIPDYCLNCMKYGHLMDNCKEDESAYEKFKSKVYKLN